MAQNYNSKNQKLLSGWKKGKGTTKDDLERKANKYLLKNS